MAQNRKRLLLGPLGGGGGRRYDDEFLSLVVAIIIIKIYPILQYTPHRVLLAQMSICYY